MAYTAIAVYPATSGGTTVTESAGVAGGAGTGYKFPNDGQTRLYIRNTSTNTPSCVILSGGTFQGLSLGDTTVSPGSTGVRIVGPFPKDLWDQQGADAGYVYIYFSGSNETDLRVAAIS